MNADRLGREKTMNVTNDKNLRDESLFKPLYLILRWNKFLTTRSCVTLAIYLLSLVALDATGRPVDCLEVMEKGGTCCAKIRARSRLHMVSDQGV